MRTRLCRVQSVRTSLPSLPSSPPIGTALPFPLSAAVRPPAAGDGAPVLDAGVPMSESGGGVGAARRALFWPAMLARVFLKSAASAAAERSLVKVKVTPAGGIEDGGMNVTLRLFLPDAGGDEKRAEGQEGGREGGAEVSEVVARTARASTQRQHDAHHMNR